MVLTGKGSCEVTKECCQWSALQVFVPSFHEGLWARLPTATTAPDSLHCPRSPGPGETHGDSKVWGPGRASLFAPEMP